MLKKVVIMPEKPDLELKFGVLTHKNYQMLVEYVTKNCYFDKLDDRAFHINGGEIVGRNLVPLYENVSVQLRIPQDKKKREEWNNRLVGLAKLVSEFEKC